MIRFSSLLVCFLVGLSGCADHDLRIVYPDGAIYGCSPSDGGITPDMIPAPAKCSAANGLPGVNLICVDFKALQDQPLGNSPPTQLAMWDFTTNCGGMFWEIAGGKLQIKNFSSFASACSFTTRALTSNEYQPYTSFTLSVVQTVDLNEAKQKVQVMLGADDPLSHLIYQATGTSPRQRNIYEIAKAALPNGGTTTYQPWFKINSTLAGGATGWQIESIAVMGNP